MDIAIQEKLNLAIKEIHKLKIIIRINSARQASTPPATMNDSRDPTPIVP